MERLTLPAIVRARAPRLAPGLPLPALGGVLAQIAVAATLMVAAAELATIPRTTTWIAFGALALGAAAGQLARVEAPGNFSYQLSLSFLFAGAILLPAGLIGPLVAAALVPEWIRFRYPWYMQASNMANLTLSGMAAHAAIALSPAGLDGALAAPTLAAAVAAFVVTNHGLLSVMLRLARGHKLRDTGLFSPLHLGIAATLTSLGAGIALAWEVQPGLAAIAALPVLLTYQALRVPALEAESHLDPKTGLANVRRFQAVGDQELRRAARYDRPLAILMCDLDHLRTINNDHGHLAGDAVLRDVAQALAALVREDDLAVRFGGEEFAILMPEADLAAARLVAERLRRGVEALRVKDPEGDAVMRVTISIGAAERRPGELQIEQLVLAADRALYRAKDAGRNQVRCREPASMEVAADTG